jgi:hypothetical protein
MNILLAVPTSGKSYMLDAYYKSLGYDDYISGRAKPVVDTDNVIRLAFGGEGDTLKQYWDWRKEELANTGSTTQHNRYVRELTTAIANFAMAPAPGWIVTNLHGFFKVWDRVINSRKLYFYRNMVDSMYYMVERRKAKGGEPTENELALWRKWAEGWGNPNYLSFAKKHGFECRQLQRGEFLLDWARAPGSGMFFRVFHKEQTSE